MLIAEDATEPANAARVAVLLAPPVAGLTGYDRAAYLFPDSETETARAEWRAVKAAGGVAAYWKQSARGWGKAG